jgi:hypothetical protein
VCESTDLFTVEVWQPVGLIRYHVLFVMHIATRRVHISFHLTHSATHLEKRGLKPSFKIAIYRA